MQLYIHFGIYKAGSSFLQYILANSKPYLIQEKIFFPDSKEDSKMKSGVISRGNADGLETALQKKDIDLCTKILMSWNIKAGEKNCNIVLISAESLVHQLAKSDAVSVLLSAAKTANYEKISMMGFFRDLVDHAISTYKHRGKSGKIPDYKHWIEEVYETPKLFENLATVRGQFTEIDWTFRKFAKNSEVLKQAFFKDWLQIGIPNFAGRSTVNESVTLSEVLVMNELREYFPLVTDYFVNDLKTLPKYEKAQDTSVEATFQNTFYTHLYKKKNALDQINSFLPPDEKLEIGGISAPSDLSTDILKQITLSQKQIQILIKRIIFFSKPKGKLIAWRREILNELKKLGFNVLLIKKILRK